MFGDQLPAALLRCQFAARHREPNRRHRRLRRVEQVQSEIGGKLPAHGDAPYAVSLHVQARREDANAEAPWLDGEHAAADAAFRGQTGSVKPFPRGVIHAACRHHGQDVVHILLGDSANTRDRVHAAIGKRCADDREIPAGDADRALLEVGFNGRRSASTRRGCRLSFPASCRRASGRRPRSHQH